MRARFQLRQSADVVPGPVVILTIANGAGHTRAAEAIAAAVRAAQPAAPPALVIDVADYMTPLARLSHVTAYLWLIKHAPGLWDYVDRYQKRRSHTSPEWYYRHGCRRLFALARQLQPRALVATEVGCCEIAALIKRDLSLDAPLVAVNVNYDSDRAWVQPEVDLYCMATEEARDELFAHGAPRERLAAWGVPLPPGLANPSLFRSHEKARAKICRWLALDASKPLLLIAGGSEGMGRIEEIVERLSRLDQSDLQLIVLAGRNARLKVRCEQIARRRTGATLRVMGWTESLPELMRAVDLMISKLGNTFDEAVAAELPLVALEPPPGSERVQYRLLDKWNVGRAVRTIDEMVEVIVRLLASPGELAMMRGAHSSQN